MVVEIYIYVLNCRYLLDLGGIYMFYAGGKGSGLLAFRLLGVSEDFQWYYQIAIPYRTWNHVAITMKSGKMTTFLNGRYNGSPMKRTLKLDWKCVIYLYTCISVSTIISTIMGTFLELFWEVILSNIRVQERLLLFWYFIEWCGCYHYRELTDTLYDVAS